MISFWGPQYNFKSKKVSLLSNYTTLT